MTTTLADAARAAPTSAGTYYLLAEDGELLYVGKATSIRSRLQQHAAGRVSHPRLDKLFAAATSVRWETAADVDAAAAREADVIVSLRPRFNAAIGLEGRWNYVVVTAADDRASFVLSTQRPPKHPGRRAYGCFPHLGRGVSSQPGIACSDGYTALLRLLWAASASTTQIPARLTRSAPDAFDLRLDASLSGALDRFLSGTSDRLLRELEVRAETDLKMLAPGLLRDRALALAFYRNGPRALRQLRRRRGVSSRLVSRAQLESLIAADLEDAIGPYKSPPRPTEEDDALGRRARRWARA